VVEVTTVTVVGATVVDSIVVGIVVEASVVVKVVVARVVEVEAGKVVDIVDAAVTSSTHIPDLHKIYFVLEKEFLF
jgi:hypothetical protein